MRRSNYDKTPSVNIDGILWKGWEEILNQLSSQDGKRVLLVECYQGVYTEEILNHFSTLSPQLIIDTKELFKSEPEIISMTAPYMTDDRLFGHRANLTYADFFDKEKVADCLSKVEQCKGLSIVIGHGAAEIFKNADTLIYADMSRWEIQLRSRQKKVHGLGLSNFDDAPSIHYKRGYFIDWIVCDNLKKRLLHKADYWLDTITPEMPKMISGNTLRKALDTTAHRPFRVVPFFDPAPWGGQWMKEVCDLDKTVDNFGWCFDCVPEENSILYNIRGETFEIPANDVVFYRTRELLGAPVEARFGQDFPIRFDFLDTMGGGNLSLQVHPTTQYIRDTFGIYYTQDESYYLLDAKDDAHVYLGLKIGIEPQQMINELRESQKTGKAFEAERFVNKWQAKKHDHFLIPAGTVHCSGANAMVLEISATPSIFTFKLYDWGRLGLDGLPRPINIGHGANVIQWERQTDWVRTQLVGQVRQIAEGDGWTEEHTGLHKNEFIETRRHWFTKAVIHNTNESVNVLNLVEGEDAVVESPTNDFEPFVVHYAETFIIPASVGEYTIRPCGLSEGKRCGTIKAYIKY